MCCQITPAIGQEPMKPMTTMRFDFMVKKTPNAECRKRSSPFGVRRWTFGVRCLLSLKRLHHHRRIAGHNRIRRYALHHYRAGSDDGIFADGDALQNDRVHPDPDVVGDFHRACFEFWAGWAILIEWRNGLRID